MGFILRGATDIDTSAGVRSTVTTGGSAPCRRCLQDAAPGEAVVLVSHDPFRTDSPYRGASPVFVHAEPCEPYVGTEVPDQQRRRLLSVRSYDSAAMMLDSDVVEGADLETVLERLLDDEHATFVHVHTAKPGCFALRVDRDR